MFNTQPVNKTGIHREDMFCVLSVQSPNNADLCTTSCTVEECVHPKVISS